MDLDSIKCQENLCLKKKKILQHWLYKMPVKLLMTFS